MLRMAREWRDDVEGNQQKVDQAIPRLAPLPGNLWVANLQEEAVHVIGQLP